MKFELKTLTEYSEEAMLSELRRVVELLNGERLTRKRFDSMARVHSSTLENRFGSWSAALDKAGINPEIAPRPKVIKRVEVLQEIQIFLKENPGQPVPQSIIAERLGINRGTLSRRFGDWGKLLSAAGITPLLRRYTDEECFENILTLWTHYGRQPHFGELKKAPSKVGPKAYVGRWGGWRAALAAFIEKVNQPCTEENVPIINKSVTVQQAADISRAPRTIPLSLRYAILSRDKFRCVACGASPAKDGQVELHLDHILPWSKGGQNNTENLRTLCSQCNLGKGARVDT